ncbi:MAG: STAS domain-containing protein [Parasporobacterium sp.]|nr:STAS domain-containing protein [Parasporobacterium sp.]
MKIDTKRNGTEFTVLPDGEVNAVTAKELDEVIVKELPGTKLLILDFEKCDYLSSAGLRVLLAAYKELKKSGGRMLLRNLGEYITEALEATGLDGVFDIQ